MTSTRPSRQRKMTTMPEPIDLTTVLQNAQNAISGLYVREDPDE